MTQLEQIQQQLDRIERITLFRAKEIFDIDEVSWYTGLQKGTIRNYVRGRKIPYYKMKNDQLRFKKEEITAWLTSNRIATQEKLNKRADEILLKMKS